MPQEQNPYGLPGKTAKRSHLSRKVLLNEEPFMLSASVLVPSNAVDSTNSPTTKLRPGLVLVKVVAAGATKDKYVPQGHADAPLAAVMVDAIILSDFIQMLDIDNVAQEQQVQGWIHAIVDDAKILHDGAAAPEIDKAREILAMVHFRK